MGWYNHIENTLTKKQASAKDIAFNAIQLLDNGLNPRDVATIFTSQMKAEDPTFDASQISDADANNLKTYLQGISANPAAGNMPGSDPTQGLGNMPGSDPTQGLRDMPGSDSTQGLGDMPGSDPTQGLGDMPGSDPTQGLSDMPEDLNEDGTPDENAGLDIDNIPEFGDFEETTPNAPVSPNEVAEVFEATEPETPMQQEIEQEDDAQAIDDMIHEVPEILQPDQFADMTLDLNADDFEGIEEKKHIEQRNFSIPASQIRRDTHGNVTSKSNIKKLMGIFNSLNKIKIRSGQQPMTISWRTKDGDMVNAPTPYPKEYTDPRTGESTFSDYVDFVLEGEPPNPEGDPMKVTRLKNGQEVTEFVKYEIVGSIGIVPIEGYEAQEEKFPTVEDALSHAARMNAEDPTRPYVVAKDKSGKYMRNRTQSDKAYKEKYPSEYGKFYPSTYKGKWRTIVDKYPGSPNWDRKFEEGNPLDCDHCKKAKRGMTARRSVYVALEFSVNDLVFPNDYEVPELRGKRRDPTKEERDAAPQRWIGTACVDGEGENVKLIEALEKFKEMAIGAERTGRVSDSFGGSQGSPKGLEDIMANYLKAGGHNGSNWFNRNQLGQFRRYYFGSFRQEIRNARFQLWEWEKLTEEYPEKTKEYEEYKKIYPYRLKQWEENEARARQVDPNHVPDLERKPVDPRHKMPKKPGKKPDPPMELPWGEPTEEHQAEAKKVRDWWKAKQNDPDIKFDEIEKSGTNLAAGQKMHNMASIAMWGKINGKLWDYFKPMMDLYARNKASQQRATENPAFNLNRQRQLQPAPEIVAPMQQPEENIDFREQPAAELAAQEEEIAAEQRGARTARDERLRAQGIELVDIAGVPAYGNFTSELKYVRSQPTGTGTMFTFKDDHNNDYVFWDKHAHEEREPNPQFANFQIGENYILGGKKSRSGRRNTALNNVRVIDPDAPAPAPAEEAPAAEEAPLAEEDIMARPGTIPEEAIVPERVPERTPEIAPEAPVERAPVEDTILGLGEEEKAQKLQNMKDIGEYAKYVIQNGKEPDTQRRGRVIPGNPMTIEELIPIYIKEIAGEWPNFDSEHFTERLTESYREYGDMGVISIIGMVPSFARNMI